MSFSTIQRILLAFFVVNTCTFLYAQDLNSVYFIPGELEQIFQKGHIENKHIFVNTVSQDCNLCPNQNDQMFVDPNVSHFYNSNFLNYNLNLDRNQYTILARILDMGTIPTMLFVNTKGHIVKKAVGISTAQALLQAGKEFISQKQFTRTDWDNLANMDNLYKHNYRDPEFLAEYIILLKAFEKSYNKPLNEYLSLLSPQQFKEKEVRNLLFYFSDNLENHAIDYFLLDIDHFKVVLGGQKINQKIKVAIYNSIRTAIAMRRENLFHKALSVVDKAHLPNQEEFKFYITIEYALGTNNMDLFSKTVIRFMKQNRITDFRLLNDMAHKFLDFNDRQRLKYAQDWINESIRINANYQNYLTKALLLNKKGDCNSAEKAAQSAIYQAKMTNQSYIEASQLINTINGIGCD